MIKNNLTKKLISTALSTLFSSKRPPFLEQKTIALLDRWTFIDFFSKFNETLSYIDIPFGRSSNVDSSMIFGPQLSLLLIKDRIKVGFITDQDELSIWWFRFGNFVPFSCYIGEGCKTGKVKYQHNSVTSFEICGYYRPVFLLPSSVPDIKLYVFPLNCYFLDFEIYGCDGGCLVSQKVSLNVLPEKSRFAHTRITYDYYLIF